MFQNQWPKVLPLLLKFVARSTRAKCSPAELAKQRLGPGPSAEIRRVIHHTPTHPDDPAGTDQVPGGVRAPTLGSDLGAPGPPAPLRCPACSRTCRRTDRRTSSIPDLWTHSIGRTASGGARRGAPSTLCVRGPQYTLCEGPPVHSV